MMAFIFRFLRSHPEEYKPLKIVLGFPVGFGIGSAFYIFLLGQSNLPKMIQYYLGTFFCVIFSIGYASSAQIRCMCWLLVPSLFSKGGRSFITTIIVAYLIQGPISNIILNGKIIVLSFKCGSELFKNQSLTRMSLSRKPMEDTLVEMKRNNFQLDRFSSQMRMAFDKIENEIEGQGEVEKVRHKTRMIDDSQHSESRADFIEERRQDEPTDTDAESAEKQYAKKADYRCQDIFNTGVENCNRAIEDLYKKCLDNVKIIGFIICKLVAINFVCNILRLVPNLIGYTCDSMPVIGEGLGEVYMEEKAMVESFGSNQNISFQYKVFNQEQILNVTTIEELQKNLINEFERREYWIDVGKELELRVLSFTFILLLKSSYDYTKSYLSDLDFDNYYVTDYFRHIDKRREISGKSKLLPLRKIERKHLKSSLSCKLTAKEKRKMFSAMFLIAIRIGVVLNVILLDRAIFTVLTIIKNQSRIDYRQTGHQKILIKTEGTGFLSNIIRMMLYNLNKEHSLDEISTNFPCLPDPILTDRKINYKIIGLYVINFIILLSQTYGFRLRRLVAAFFFRRREKARTLYLYNNTMKKRKEYVHYMKSRVHDLAKERQREQEYSMSYGFLKALSACFGCVENRLRKRQSCLICEERIPSNIVRPQTACGCIFCNECWKDMDSLCPGCLENETDVEKGLED